MKLTGDLLFGAREAPATRGTLMALNFATNANIDPEFAPAGVEEVDSAVHRVDEAFARYSNTTLGGRAAVLEHIADGLKRSIH